MPTPRWTVPTVVAIVALAVICVTLAVFVIASGVDAEARQAEYNAYSEETCVVSRVTNAVRRCTGGTNATWSAAVDVWIQPLHAPPTVTPVHAQLKYPVVRDHTIVGGCVDSLRTTGQWIQARTVEYPLNRMTPCYANKHYATVFLRRDTRTFVTWHLKLGVIYAVFIVVATVLAVTYTCRSTKPRRVEFPERVQSPHPTRTPPPRYDRRHTNNPAYHSESE